jgi:signal transduction histidine kinase
MTEVTAAGAGKDGGRRASRRGARRWWDVSGWPLGTRITALCSAAALILLIVAGSAAVLAIRDRDGMNDQLHRLNPLRVYGARLQAAVSDEQAGLASYVVTADAADLALYTDGVASESQVAALIRQLLIGDATHTGELDTVVAQMAAWRRDTAVPAITAVQAGDLTTARALVNDPGRAEIAAARATITALRTALLDMRNRGADRLSADVNRLVDLVLVAGIVVVLTGLVLAILLRRMVSAPVAALAGEVRRVAAGDLEHTVTGSGAPEVIDLAADVETMRARVVSDLATVIAARAQVEAAHQLLQQHAVELARSNRDLEQFAYAASHELQEPLRKVASFCQLLQRRYAGHLDERANQYIFFAVDGAARMQRLINDLLAFSRVGRVNAQVDDVDMGVVMTQVAQQMDGVLARAGVEVTWDELPVVRGDQELLTALLANLVGNSAKFRREDVTTRIRLSVREAGAEWEFACADNGIGIAPEYIEKVFVIFQRLHARDAYPGTGIGLAISKKIVEHHGGRIWVDTQVNEGTTIRFTIPRQPAALPAGGTKVITLGVEVSSDEEAQARAD